MSKVVVENVGPVKSFEFEVPEDGGVVVLRGRNGAGKSHILDAVQSLVSGDGSVPLRDGQSKGRVEGLGATIKFSKRTTRSGALEVESLTGDVDPATLVDPGMVDPERADAARIKALLTLAGVQATPADFVHNQTKIVLPEGETDPVKLSGLAAREYQRLAREQESVVADLERQLAQLGTVDVDYDGETAPEVLEEKLIDAKAQLASLKQRRDEYLDQKTIYDCACEDLRQSSGDIDKKLHQARAKLADIDARHEQALVLANNLQLQLVAVEASLVEIQREHDNAALAVTNHEGFLRQYEAIKAIVDAGCPNRPDTAIEIAEKAVEICRDDMQKAALVRKNDEVREKRDELENDLARARGQATLLRSFVPRCEETLSLMVRKSGTGLFVEGGRLRIATDRGPDELFGELSHGERWKAAIDVCVSSVGNKALIVIPQEAWEGIDPGNRTDLAEHARANHVTILTAECGDGEIEAKSM
jgi:energy-coupling factor transporter ATP-binding protein EcfA2